MTGATFCENGGADVIRYRKNKKIKKRNKNKKWNKNKKRNKKRNKNNNNRRLLYLLPRA